MIFIKLFWTFIKIGTFGFGGGYAMLSMIQEEVVTRNGWMTNQEFTDLIAISQMTPGPIGINTSTYAGYNALANLGYPQLVCILGALMTTIALCLPSFIMISVISYFFIKFRSNSFFSHAMLGIRPLSVSLIALAALSLVSEESFIDYVSVILFAGALVLSVKYKLHPLLILSAAAVLGLIIY
ncbi:chromate transporter [Sphingobacterium psychroaquaticum]|uniref:chromate transporter n=1 Tax=Sphingobacterium psychroaquaticum TaxID=561061 RepID=UPI00106A5EE7|nr:chromate transporter [Sphingobacterium psychroaquaticum]QBQ42901.1 chromate transporter [Sphingobacterium psychroaquaticum]